MEKMPQPLILDIIYKLPMSHVAYLIAAHDCDIALTHMFLLIRRFQREHRSMMQYAYTTMDERPCVILSIDENLRTMHGDSYVRARRAHSDAFKRVREQTFKRHAATYTKNITQTNNAFRSSTFRRSEKFFWGV